MTRPECKDKLKSLYDELRLGSEDKKAIDAAIEALEAWDMIEASADWSKPVTADVLPAITVIIEQYFSKCVEEKGEDEHGWIQ